MIVLLLRVVVRRQWAAIATTVALVTFFVAAGLGLGGEESLAIGVMFATFWR